MFSEIKQKLQVFQGLQHIDFWNAAFDAGKELGVSYLAGQKPTKEKAVLILIDSAVRNSELNSRVAENISASLRASYSVKHGDFPKEEHVITLLANMFSVLDDKESKEYKLIFSFLTIVKYLHENLKKDNYVQHDALLDTTITFEDLDTLRSESPFKKYVNSVFNQFKERNIGCVLYSTDDDFPERQLLIDRNNNFWIKARNNIHEVEHQSENEPFIYIRLFNKQDNVLLQNYFYGSTISDVREYISDNSNGSYR